MRQHRGMPVEQGNGDPDPPAGVPGGVRLYAQVGCSFLVRHCIRLVLVWLMLMLMSYQARLITEEGLLDDPLYAGLQVAEAVQMNTTVTAWKRLENEVYSLTELKEMARGTLNALGFNAESFDLQSEVHDGLRFVRYSARIGGGSLSITTQSMLEGDQLNVKGMETSVVARYTHAGAFKDALRWQDMFADAMRMFTGEANYSLTTEGYIQGQLPVSEQELLGSRMLEKIRARVVKKNTGSDVSIYGYLPRIPFKERCEGFDVNIEVVFQEAPGGDTVVMIGSPVVINN